MASLLRRSLALTVLTTLPFTVQAAKLYKVELLVFSHENSNGVEQEYWPSLPPLDLSASVYPQPWDGYPLANYEELPQNDLQLGGDAAALSRSAGYKLLYHRGWLQSIGSKASARGVRVKADFDQYQLDGMLKIYRNRFLHAQPTLELKTATPWQHTQPQPLPNATDDAGIRVVTPLEESADGRQSWRMDQSRRMRSNETHYIDHPRFGVLLRIRALN
jgi:hypothetical protein